MIATHRSIEQLADTLPPAPTDAQRWAHTLVLDMLRANVPFETLAAHLDIPFDTLRHWLRLPEVRAEIEAYEELTSIRARLLGQTARPLSLRKLLDVLESPAPEPGGENPEADQRTLHRHAELIRRTATTIARESRALAPKPQRGATSASSEGSPSTHTDDNLARDQVPSDTSSDEAPAAPNGVPPAPVENAPNAPNPPSRTPGRSESPARQSPTDALRAADGSTRAKSRDRPAA